MIQDICDGMAYILTVYKEPTGVVVNGKIQYDIDFLGRKRTTIKLDDNNYRLVSELNSHRLELNDISGQVYKGYKYYAIWYPEDKKCKDIIELFVYLESEKEHLVKNIEDIGSKIKLINSVLSKINNSCVRLALGYGKSYCSYCGKELKMTDKFCPNCGHKIIRTRIINKPR